jgi:hypothetical protein
MGWSERRQILYYIVALIGLVAFSFVVWRVFFVHTPTCFDHVQNGDERGVDCDGSCALICPSTAKTPTVLWARSFETAPHTYTAAAYIQNNNVAEGGTAKRVRYSFQILDSKNVLIIEREGYIDIPPQQIVPVVESQIDVGTRVPAKTFFEFDDAPVNWRQVASDSIQKLRIVNPRFENDRLTASIANDSLTDAKKVTVVAVLFDLNGVARAASKTTLAKIGKKSSEDITFTWPGADPTYIPQLTILPSF